MSLSLSLYLFLSIFFGHVMSSHHSEQMSQRSQVSRIALRRCSQKVFVFVVFVAVAFVVVVFIIVFIVSVTSSHHSDQTQMSAVNLCVQNLK